MPRRCHPGPCHQGELLERGNSSPQLRFPSAGGLGGRSGGVGAASVPGFARAPHLPGSLGLLQPPTKDTPGAVRGRDWSPTCSPVGHAAGAAREASRVRSAMGPRGGPDTDGGGMRGVRLLAALSMHALVQPDAPLVLQGGLGEVRVCLFKACEVPSRVPEKGARKEEIWSVC